MNSAPNRRLIETEEGGEIKMARLVKHHAPTVDTHSDGHESVDVFGPVDRAFERMFGTWLTSFPLRHSFDSAKQWLTDAFIPVDEFHKDGTLVIRAEIPGIDPDKDVDLTVTDGMLHMAVTRREETNVEDEHYVRQEMRYGSFERLLPLPEGVDDADITATYKDGILEVVVPVAEPTETKKIVIAKS
jgi:HSP20 family protein